MRANPVHPLRRLPVVVLLALAGFAGSGSVEAQEPRSRGSVGSSAREGRVEDPSGRGWLGIAFREPGTPGAPGDPRGVREGVLISGVLRGSPAHRTGIRPGEILLRIEGEPIVPGRLEERARSIRVGDSVSLTLRNPSGVRQVVLVAGERPERVPSAVDPDLMARVDSVQDAVRRRLDALRERMRVDRPYRPYSLGADFVAGARMVALNEGLAEYFEVEGGVLTLEVLEGSPADESGLRPGDVIVAVGERETGSVEELRAALLGRVGPEVELRVVRSGEEVEIRLPS